MSSAQTPRQRGLARPSYGNSPNNFSASTSTAFSRSVAGGLKALPATPAGSSNNKTSDGGDLALGDEVNVPGEMWGTVKFIGSVKGKAGVFVGVELAEPFAARGKNDGDVDGVHYFNTSAPGAGIFLPVHRAEKRGSPGSLSLDSFPGTPNTPTYSTLNGKRTGSKDGITPKATPQPTPKFAQSVGPGVRPSSPHFKPKRPSLPRPESPLRKQPPTLAPTPASSRNLSQSVAGSASRTPAKSGMNFKASTTSRPSIAAGHTTTLNNSARPYSRSSSRLGNGIAEEDDRHTHNGAVGLATTTNARTTSSGSVPSFSQPLRSPSRLGSAGGGSDSEIQRLRKELSERDRRLEEQALSLADMEQSVKELSAILPDSSSPAAMAPNGHHHRHPHHHSEGGGGHHDDSIPRLRQLLREKNDKIALLTAEFDAHRADFRSTLDSLEMASTETERVYEEQKADLLAQLAETRQGREDFEGVARQLKALEELVAELEEGLEESRRGEAEARGEVEFLRGEVERGRSELRRERERFTAGAGAGGAAGKRGSAEGGIGRELEKKEDEIRGLKAIIHGLSSGSAEPAAAVSALQGTTVAAGEGGKELETLRRELEASKKEKEALEDEVENLRREAATASASANATTNGHARNESDITATAATRSRGNTIKPPPALFSSSSAATSPAVSSPTKSPTHTREKSDPIAAAAAAAGGTTYCEMCESTSHDTLACSKFVRSSSASLGAKNGDARGSVNGVYSPGKENEGSGVEGKGEDGDADVNAGGKEEDKWCALCEQDGHLAFDCPEQY